MPKHVMVALSNPVEGREQEFNEWYDNVHLADILKAPGFISAQRYRLSATAPQADGTPSPPSLGFRYLAIYEVEADNMQVAMNRLFQMAGEMHMVISPALAPHSVHGFTVIGQTMNRL